MAEHAHDEYHRGEMEIGEQAATYNLFMNLTKWGSLALAAILTFIVLWFCTEAGFLGAAMAGVVLFVVGFFVLKKKTEDAATH
jgi:hypothetical protein